VIAAAKSGETKKADLENEARAAFDMNFELKGKETLSRFKVKVVAGNELSLETTIKKPTTIMGIFGRPMMEVYTEAATYLPSDTALDIALVLDRTGSMAGSNIAGLITASDDFIKQLKSEGSDTRIAVVPFQAQAQAHRHQALHLDVQRQRPHHPAAAQPRHQPHLAAHPLAAGVMSQEHQQGGIVR